MTAARLLLPLLLLLTTAARSAEDTAFDPVTAARLMELIETAIGYDIYNRRCRGFTSSMHEKDVQKRTVERFGKTLTQITEIVEGQPLQRLRPEMEAAVIDQIRDLGGCREAKRRGYLTRIDQRYRELYDWLNDLP